MTIRFFASPIEQYITSCFSHCHRPRVTLAQQRQFDPSADAEEPGYCPGLSLGGLQPSVLYFFMYQRIDCNAMPRYDRYPLVWLIFPVNEEPYAGYPP